MQPMAAIALDTAVERFGLPAPHHLKVDVDGAEGLVLAGAFATLRGTQLRSVLIEATAKTGDQVTGLLRRRRTDPGQDHDPRQEGSAVVRAVRTVADGFLTRPTGMSWRGEMV
jgi:hypothetical protein